jgi:hypothetical protein
MFQFESIVSCENTVFLIYVPNKQYSSLLFYQKIKHYAPQNPHLE